MIWRNSKDEMMQGNPAIRTLDPYSLRTLSVYCLYAGTRTLSAASVLSAYCILPSRVFPYCICTVFVLYPYSVRRLGGIPHRNLVGAESMDAVDRVYMDDGGGSTDKSTEPAPTDFIHSIRSIRE